MRISGIISEYNPFHNGHALHLDRTRAAGAEGIVCVLGGNFTQRGEPSLLRKQAKARAALLCGADLVLELGLPYVLSAAADFALGGVRLLDALGCVDTLSFGAENDIFALESTARAVEEIERQKLLSSALETGRGFAGAREQALRQAGKPQEADVIARPNNILAVEYLRALKTVGSRMVPLAVLREGTAHDAPEPAAQMASASAIRRMLLEKQPAEQYLPAGSRTVLADEVTAGRAPVFPDALEQAMLSRLRLMTPETIRLAPGISEGLENRIFRAVSDGTGISEIVSLAGTKRYPAARIRRILACCAVGVTSELSHMAPPYLRVLAANSTGHEILRIAKQTAQVPIVSRSCEILRLNDNANRFFGVECAAADLHALAYRPVGKMGGEMTDNAFLCR